MTKHISAGLRILVGASTYADAAAALHIIRRLPKALCASIGGVLIEDEDMLSACHIPDRRIVLLSGVTTLAPSLSQVRTLLKADARAFRHSLAQTADQSGKEWVFAQDKGELVSTALRAAAGWDVLVLGYRHLHKVRGRVVLLERSGSTKDETREASRQFSTQLSADHIVFSIREDGDRTTQAIPSNNTIQFDTFDESLNALARTNAQAVLVDLRQGPVRNQSDLKALVEAARCPVIVFGASTIQGLLEHTTQITPKPDSNGYTNDG